MTLPPALRRLTGAAVAALALSSLLAPTAQAGEAEIRSNLASAFPQLGSIDEIRKTPMPGLFEGRVGTQIFYTDENGNFLIQGSLIDLKNRKNLTEERTEALTAVNFKDLPFKDAIKVVNGSGKRQLAVFADPNCGYCKIFEKDLQKLKDTTIYTFLIPILGQDSANKSRDIWCAKDRAATWTNWMVKGQRPAPAECDTAAVQRNVALSRKHGITGTPTLFFPDNTRAPGALPVSEVDRVLNNIN